MIALGALFLGSIGLGAYTFTPEQQMFRGTVLCLSFGGLISVLVLAAIR